jgi:hypothetical protein
LPAVRSKASLNGCIDTGRKIEGCNQCNRLHSSTKLLCTGVPVRTGYQKYEFRFTKKRMLNARLTQTIHGSYSLQFMRDFRFMIFDFMALVEDNIIPSPRSEPATLGNITIIRSNNDVNTGSLCFLEFVANMRTLRG